MTKNLIKLRTLHLALDRQLCSQLLQIFSNKMQYNNWRTSFVRAALEKSNLVCIDHGMPGSVG